jgi:hypothetical protein
VVKFFDMVTFMRLTGPDVLNTENESTMMVYALVEVILYYPMKSPFMSALLAAPRTNELPVVTKGDE